MEKESDKLLTQGILPLAFITFALLMPKVFHPGDTWYWICWMKDLKAVGITNAYSIPGCNYPPIFLYILSIFGSFQETYDDILRNVNHLKSIVLIFDFIGIYLCIYLLKSYKISPFYALLILLNIAYLYNTMLWGQVDSIHTTLCLAAIIFAYRGNVLISIIAYVIALNMKLQSIIFFPVFALALIPNLKNPHNIISMLKGGIATQVIILAPFIMAGKFSEFWKMVTGAVGFYPVVSMQAHNIWNLTLWSNYLMETSNEITFAGLTYKLWGTIMFCISSFLILLPILGNTIIKLLTPENSDHPNTEKSILLASGMIALAFFYFNTEMHERYSHPAILFLGIYAIICKDYIIYILTSVAYFLNMEVVLKSLQLKNYSTALFDPRFISIIFLLSIIIGFYKLYKLNVSNFKLLIQIAQKVLEQKSFKNISQII